MWAQLSGSQGVGITRAAVDMHYTQTMFISAQVYRQVGDLSKSAHCCAVTLQLQLQSGACCPIHQHCCPAYMQEQATEKPLG